MAQTTWTGLLSGSSSPLLATGDVVAFVDVSDATQSPQGSLVKTTVAAWLAALPSAVLVTSNAASAFAVGPNGSTNPVLRVDASTASAATGITITGAAAGGGVAVVARSSGTDEALTINAKGTGPIGIGSVSTGRVTITPVTTITGALTLSSTGLVYDGKTLTGSTGTGNMVLSASPTLSGTVGGALTFSGALTLGSTLTGGATSDIAINTNKFTVAASTGNTVVAGTLGVTGAAALSSTLTVATSIRVGTVASNGAVAGSILIGNNVDYYATNSDGINRLALIRANASNRVVIGASGDPVTMPAYGAGTATFDSSGNISSASDERLKDIVGPFDSGLAALRTLTPILYRWNKQSGMEMEGVYAGFSAQNAQKATEYATGTSPKGFLSLQDRALLAVAVNAIKELDGRITALEGQ